MLQCPGMLVSPRTLVRYGFTARPQMQLNERGKRIMTLVASCALAVAIFCILALWQGGPPLLVTNPFIRLGVAVTAVIVFIVGFLFLVKQAQPPLRRRLIWTGALTTGLAVLVVRYNNTVLRVSPSSARIPVLSALPIVATPLSAVERIQGRSYVHWTSSDPTVLSVIADTDKTGGSQSVIVKALKGGRATIFAVRGVLVASARISVENSYGVVPPLCTPESTASAAPPKSTASAAPPESTASAAPARLGCVAGSITSPSGQPVGRARVSLTAASGSDTLWTQHQMTDPIDGHYEFRIPVDSATPGAVLYLAVHQQVGERNPIWFIPTNWGLDTTTRVIHSGLLRAGVYRDVDIRLQYSPRSTFAMFFLLVPAIVGLLSTIWYFGAYRPAGVVPARRTPTRLPQSESHYHTRPATQGREKKTWDPELLTRIYVFANALTWGFLLALLCLLYAFRGVQGVSLFSESLTIPVAAPAFAFLGVLVYAIYVLAEEYVQRLRSGNGGDEERHRILLALGNRIVIAPYVAIVAVLALFDRPDHPMIPFVSFFTGLWIEPVLGTLKGIGDRLVNRAPLPPAPSVKADESFAQAKALLEQNREVLTSPENVVRATVEARQDASGAKATPVIVLWVRDKAAALKEKEPPPKELRGTLSNGTIVAFPFELREATGGADSEQPEVANQALTEPHPNGKEGEKEESEEGLAPVR